MLSWRCGIITVKFSFLKGLSQFAVMSVFINYEGPNLGKKQKRVVRSQAMVAVRGQQRQQAKTTAADVAKNTTISNPRL